MKIGKVKLGIGPVVCAVLQDSFTPAALAKLKALRIRLVELRIDQFRCFDMPFIQSKIRALKREGFSVIGTVRRKQEGGGSGLSEQKRLEIFHAILPIVDAVDVELKSGICRDVLKQAKKLKKTGIVSFHDFRKTPSFRVLAAYLKEAKRFGADIFKVAAFAKQKRDVSTLLHFTVRFCGEHVIVISMGRLGAPSRVLFPQYGSLLSYGYGGKRTAPGQLSVQALVRVFAAKKS